MPLPGRRRTSLALSLAVGFAIPVSAAAQEPGVTVNPDAPAQLEYALPVDSARSDADPNRSTDLRRKEGPTYAPRFGAGIGDRTAGAGGSTSSDESSSESAGDEAGAGSGGSPAAGDPAALPRDPIVSRAATGALGPPGVEGGSSGTLIVGGLGALVLLLGGLAGWGLRRRT